MSADFPLSGTLAAPVYVVTACADGERAGCVVGFASEVSLHPPRFMACISRANATFPVAMRAGRLAVHALTEAQRDLAELSAARPATTSTSSRAAIGRQPTTARRS